MTLIFIMTSEVTAQMSRYQEVCVWTFLRFSYRFSPLNLSLSIYSYFSFYCAFISYNVVLFWPGFSLRQAGLLKKNKVKVEFQKPFFKYLSVFESFWCPPRMCLRTDATSIQGHSTGTYKEININNIRE